MANVWQERLSDDALEVMRADAARTGRNSVLRALTELQERRALPTWPEQQADLAILQEEQALLSQHAAMSGEQFRPLFKARADAIWRICKAFLPQSGSIEHATDTAAYLKYMKPGGVVGSVELEDDGVVMPEDATGGLITKSQHERIVAERDEQIADLRRQLRHQSENMRVLRLRLERIQTAVNRSLGDFK